jgi:hypothetical protein
MMSVQNTSSVETKIWECLAGVINDFQLTIADVYVYVLSLY